MSHLQTVSNSEWKLYNLNKKGYIIVHKYTVWIDIFTERQQLNLLHSQSV